MELNDILNALNKAIDNGKVFRAIETFYPTKVFSYKKFRLEVYYGLDLYYEFEDADQIFDEVKYLQKTRPKALEGFFKKFINNGLDISK